MARRSVDATNSGRSTLLILWRAFGGIDVSPRLVATEDVVNLLVLSRDLVLDLGAQPQE